MRVPDQQTFLRDDSREVWYRFFIELTANTPQTGSGSPEGVVRANNCCLYVQVGGGSAVLWVNETGPGANTGWIAK